VQIIKNAAKCLVCNEIVESKHRHDFVMCRCGNVAVDGGKDYLKRSVRGKAIKDMSVMAHDKDCYWYKDWVQCSCGAF
jgi:hypothetical protein